ncbi:hypothetical protein PpBr36_08353, partial [Pyricularia pennisetigena]|uniref:hypothetical protein n=1 Tax=Pyricularia pennisetigena TaxID=1578925 RepID=UPI00115428B9
SLLAMIRSRKRKTDHSSAQLRQGVEAGRSRRLNIERITKGDSSHQIVLGLGRASFTKSDSPGKVGQWFGFQTVSDQVYSPKGRRWYARKSLPGTSKTDLKQDMLQQDHISFINEIEHLRLLRHRHIARLAGSYTDVEGIAYLMEPVSDTTLDMFLEGQLDHDARILLRQSFGCLAAALGHIHGHSLHIEQLSSGNISVHRGKLFIGGFGALVQNPKESAYAAPETRGVCDVDGSSRDVWALGVIYLEILMRLHGMRPSEFRYWVHIYSQEAYGTDKEDSLVDCVDKFMTFVEGQGRPRYQGATAWTSALLREEPNKRPDCQALLQNILDSRYSTEFCCPECRRASVSNTLRQNNNSLALVKVGHETLRGLFACIPYIGAKLPHKKCHSNNSTASARKVRMVPVSEVKGPNHDNARPGLIREITEEELPLTRATSSMMLGFVRDSEEWSPIKTSFEAPAESRPLFASAYDLDDRASACLQHGKPDKSSELSPIPSRFSTPPQPHRIPRETSPAPPKHDPPPRESDEVVAQNLSRGCIHGEASTVQIHLEEVLERRLDSSCDEAWFKAVRGNTKGHGDCVRIFLEIAGSDLVHRVEPAWGQRTALLVAADNPNLAGANLEELVALLLEHGADPNVVDSRGDHALAKLIRRGGDTSRTIEVIARSQGADLNKPASGSLDSPLHLAVEQANVAVVSLLLHLGANVDPVNANGLTPLEAVVLQVYKAPGLRASQEQAEILQTLWDFGARSDRVRRFYLAQEEGIA